MEKMQKTSEKCGLGEKNYGAVILYCREEKARVLYDSSLQVGNRQL